MELVITQRLVPEKWPGFGRKLSLYLAPQGGAWSAVYYRRRLLKSTQHMEITRP